MRILLTGGCGFIGSAVVRRAIRTRSHEVVNVDCMTYAASIDALEEASESSRYVHVRADVADAAAMARVFAEYEPDAVMHLAAESHVDRSIDGPAAFIRTNIVGTYTLLEAARAYWSRLPPLRKSAFRFHHISTDEVFGALGPDDPPFTEATAYDPRSPYSASKAASDHLVRAWFHTYGLPSVVTICSNNYGPNQFPEKLIPLAIIKGLAGEPMPVYGKGLNVRDWLFVDDHAEALTLVLERGRVGEIYNIGGGAERRNIDVITAICEALDRLRPPSSGASHRELIRFVDDRPGHDFRYAIDFTKVRRELGWRPRHSFEAGLSATVEWYIENRKWWEPLLVKHDAAVRRGLARKQA